MVGPRLAGRLGAAKVVFARAGVDAPAKELTDAAGVGVGNPVSPFPTSLGSRHRRLQAGSRRSTHARTPPGRSGRTTRHSRRSSAGSTASPTSWPPRTDWPRHCNPEIHRSTSSRRTSSPASAPRRPSWLQGAEDAGEIHIDLSADELLYAGARLSQPMGDTDADHGRRLVRVLINGLRRR